MKKILLVVMATTMLLSNVAFASVKTNSTESKHISTAEQTNVIHLNTQDPY